MLVRIRLRAKLAKHMHVFDYLTDIVRDEVLYFKLNRIIFMKLDKN